MRQLSETRNIVAGTLLSATMLLASLAVVSPAAAGDGGAFEGRYEAQVQREQARERVRQAEGAGAQTAATGVGSSEGVVTYSQHPNSPYAYGNAAQHHSGR